MAFRGITLEPIHKNIQLRLEQLKAYHAYKDPMGSLSNTLSSLFGLGGGTHLEMLKHAELSSKTVWYRLTSNAGVYSEDKKGYTNPSFFQMGTGISYGKEGKVAGLSLPDDGSPFAGKFDTDQAAIDSSYPDYWKYNTARPEFNMLPPPGIESISVSTKGSMGSLKTCDFKIKVFHPADLDHIEKAFMSPGITCFLEWGWSGVQPLSKPGTGIKDFALGKSGADGANALESQILAKKLGLPQTSNIMAANKLDEDVLTVLGRKPGQYDAMLGVITKFNWSLDSDGSYNINVSMISPNSLTMGVKLETSILGATKTTGYFKDDGGIYRPKANSSGNDGSTSKSMPDAEFLCWHMRGMMRNLGLVLEKMPFEVTAETSSAVSGSKQKKSQAATTLKGARIDEDDYKNTFDKAWEARKKWYYTAEGSGFTVTVDNSTYAAGIKLYDDSKSVEIPPYNSSEYGERSFGLKTLVTAPTKKKAGSIDTSEALSRGWNQDLINKAQDWINAQQAVLNFEAAAAAASKSHVEKNNEALKAKVTTRSEAYHIEGAGDSKYRYFASDVTGLLTRLYQPGYHEIVEFTGKANKLYNDSGLDESCLFTEIRPLDRGQQKVLPEGDDSNVGFEYAWQNKDLFSKGAILGVQGYLKGMSKPDDYSTAYFVTWRWIEDYLLRQALPKDEGEEPADGTAGYMGDPLMTLNSTHIGTFTEDDSGKKIYFPNQCLNHPLIRSMDHNVCYLLKGDNETSTDLKGHGIPDASFGEMEVWEDKNKGRKFFPVIPEGDYPIFGNASTASIRDILVRIEHVVNVLNSQRTFEGFVTTLLSDINEACGKPWDFQLLASETDSHVMSVVDKNCVDLHAEATGIVNPIISKRRGESNNSKVKFVVPDTSKDDASYAKNIDQYQSFKDHYTFKGRGQGNILTSINLSSKLPKSIQAMAFMANKNQSNQTPDKNMSDFNIYGEKIVDLFYTKQITAIKTKEELDVEATTKKQTMFLDWLASLMSFYTLEKNSDENQNLNPRQINQQLVAQVVLGNNTIRDKEKKVKTTSLLPLELKLTLDGISGIYQGNSIRLLTIKNGGVLPNRYTDNIIWQITKVSHSIQDSGWTTTLECMMRYAPEEE